MVTSPLAPLFPRHCAEGRVQKLLSSSAANRAVVRDVVSVEVEVIDVPGTLGCLV